MASILVFLCFGVTQAKDGPFSRPHPGNLPSLSPCVPSGSAVLRVSLCLCCCVSVLPRPIQPAHVSEEAGRDRLCCSREAPLLWVARHPPPPLWALLSHCCPPCGSQGSLPGGGGALGPSRALGVAQLSAAGPPQTLLFMVGGLWAPCATSSPVSTILPPP